MKVSRNGRKLIKHFEGFSEDAYLCSAGVWTIGWGNTYVNGRPVRAGDKISKREANKLFREYLVRNVSPVIEKSVKVSITQNEFDALASFIYNLGSGAFNNSTLLVWINRGSRDQAADQFGRWVYAGGTILEGLIRRRKSEENLFVTGELEFYD